MANLRLPGPTPVPGDVFKAMSKQMIDHRGVEFAELLGRLTSNLQRAFETKNDVFVLTSSGTGAMEAAVTNTLSPGERVLAVTVGNFGDRFSKIASVYGADVNQLKFPEGEAADPQAIREALAADPAVTAVLVTHNETSTGITNDLETIAGIVKGEFDKLLLVDGISSLGSIRLPVDEWGIDVVVAGSQKGWMCPPGLAMISVSDRAWGAFRVGRASARSVLIDMPCAFGRSVLAPMRDQGLKFLAPLVDELLARNALLARGAEVAQLSFSCIEAWVAAAAVAHGIWLPS